MIGTCRYCGKLLDHFYPDCGQQPSEAPQAGVAAGALPVVNEALSDIEQVSADLEECSSLDLNEWGDRVGEALEVIRAHLHHLTAERDALRAYLKDKAIPVTPLCVEIEEQAQQRARDAHIEGLRWAQRECRYHGPGTVSEKIEAEIARLERPAPQDARLRADQEGEG